MPGSWAREFPFNIQRCTIFAWEITYINNSTVSADTLDIDDVYLIKIPSPALLSPSNAASNIPFDVSLLWSNPSGAIENTIQIAASDQFLNGIDEFTIPATNNMVVNGLDGNMTFYWRVSATTQSGTSLWSPVRRFTTRPPLPEPPALISPSSNESDVSITPAFNWRNVLGTSGYDLQVSNHTAFSTTIINQTAIADTTYAGAGLFNHIKYYWRVRSRNTFGSGNWSAADSFTTIMALPSKVITNAVANGDTVNADSVILSWLSASPNVRRYQLQFSTDSTMNTVEIDSVCDDTFQLLDNLSNGSSYWWRVRAMNSAG